MAEVYEIPDELKTKVSMKPAEPLFAATQPQRLTKVDDAQYQASSRDQAAALLQHYVDTIRKQAAGKEGGAKGGGSGKPTGQNAGGPGGAGGGGAP